MHPEWTDHTLLEISFQFEDVLGKGPGVFKANPFLAQRKTFRQALANHLETNMPTFRNLQQLSSPQHCWDTIKGDTLRFVKSFQLSFIH